MSHLTPRLIVFASAMLMVESCTLLRGPLQAPEAPRVDCASAAVVGLNWSASPRGSAPLQYAVLRDDQIIGTTRETRFADTQVEASSSYRYAVSGIRGGATATSVVTTVVTPTASIDGDAPYCPSPVIRSMTWDWPHAYRAAEGSDLWPVTWGADGNVYAFFGDGGGFGGDNHRGRTSFGIATMSGSPPTAGVATPVQSETNVYGGLDARYPSRLSGKARALLAVDSDLYAIAGIYRSGDQRFGEPQPIAGSPDHVEMWVSPRNAHSWRSADWTFCAAPTDDFCPSGFVNAGRGYRGAPDGFVYLFGTSVRASSTYLARVPRARLMARVAYRYFAGLDAKGRPRWSADAARMQPIFVDRNTRSSTLEEAVYDTGLGRYIGVAQGETLAQTSFYDAPHPWGPWTTIAYFNIQAPDGGGGWGNLSAAAGESLGVHPVNAWTSANGRTLWMTYSSDGKAGPGAVFPPAGTDLDAFHLVRVELN